MHQAKTLVTAPGAEPILIADARMYLRLTTDGGSNPEDDLVNALISSARDMAEADLQRKLITQTWDIFYDCFPVSSTGVIEIPLPPLQSVTTLKYTDVDGNEQTLDSGTYTVDTDSQPARIYPSDDNTWPDTDDTLKTVEIRVIVGYGDAGTDVPPKIITAMKLLIGHWFENRQDAVIGSTVSQVPTAYKALIGRNRMLQV